jgi:hypothetical protein
MLMMLIGLVLDGFMFARYLILPFIRILGNLFPLTYFIPLHEALSPRAWEFLWSDVVHWVYTVRL